MTTVVFRFPASGAHVIYRKEKVPKILDMWTKLWGETERSVALANLLREETGVHAEQIDPRLQHRPELPLQQSAQCFRRLHPIAGLQSEGQARLAHGGMGCRRPLPMSVIQEFKADVTVASPLEESGILSDGPKPRDHDTPDQKVRIGAGGETPLHAGLEVRISVSPIPGLRTGWLTRIEEVHPPAAGGARPGSVTRSSKGRLPCGITDMISKSLEGGVVVDTLRYALPFGSLGHAVAGRWVRKQMEELFAFGAHRCTLGSAKSSDPTTRLPRASQLKPRFSVVGGWR